MSVIVPLNKESIAMSLPVLVKQKQISCQYMHPHSNADWLMSELIKMQKVFTELYNSGNKIAHPSVDTFGSENDLILELVDEVEKIVNKKCNQNTHEHRTLESFLKNCAKKASTGSTLLALHWCLVWDGFEMRAFFWLFHFAHGSAWWITNS